MYAYVSCNSSRQKALRLLENLDSLISHPDTRLASFIALMKSDTIQVVLFSIPAVPFKEPLSANSPRAYFRFERNNAMNAMETIDREPCICIE
jgi:hypothetical protein